MPGTTAIVGLFCALSIGRGNACPYTAVKDVKHAGSMEDVQRFLKDSIQYASEYI